MILRTLIVAGSLLGLVTELRGERIVTPLDEDWRFTHTDFVSGEEAAIPTQDWQRVDLPHDWAIAGPFDKDAPARGEGGFLPTGVARYVKLFKLPRERKGRRVFVVLDGVMANSDVWINGQHVGKRPNGYVSFCCDITDQVRHGGEENVLAVRTDTSEQVASRWYTGSGIYRHVRLIEVEPQHIEPWGVAVTTPQIDAQKADVAVKVDVRNTSDEAANVTLRVRVLDDAHRETTSGETARELKANASEEFNKNISINEPRLWDIEDPQMYTLETSLIVDGKVVDNMITPFGIRTSEFNSETGYWLNGRNIKIKGVCLHHDGGAVGAAVPLGVWEYRLTKLKELGVNAIRTAHNPVAPEFLDLCDRMGFLVMDEFFDCWTVAKRRHDYHKFFEEWSHRDMRDTILRDRNHPSVIMYSVGNEIHDTPKEELAKRILKGLVEVCHDTDPSRPVTQALFRPNVSHDYDNGLADMLDVIGTNYRDLELLQAWKDNPSRKIIGTEQGHERRTWLACRDNPQHSGQFLWVGIDYLGESRRWPVTTFDSGLLDRTGHVHPRGRERQSWWSERPMVAVFRREAMTEETPFDPGYETLEWERRQVLFDDWTPPKMEAHEENVEVYSNCQQVELLLNGESLGMKELRADAGPRNWRVDFASGELVAIGRDGGQEVTREALRTASEAERIELLLSREWLKNTWDDVAIVEARIVDENGTVLPRANHKISFSTNGPGKIIAGDNGSIVTHEPFQATERHAFHGRCIVLVRATADSGEIEITASAEGLKPATATIEITPSSK